MELNWKSYGDHGRIARGEQGNWIIVTDGMWWHLNLRDRDQSISDQRRGRFKTRLAAECHAQDREDGVPILAQTDR